jgi:hypothetical protein
MSAAHCYRSFGRLAEARRLLESVVSARLSRTAHALATYGSLLGALGAEEAPTVLAEAQRTARTPLALLLVGRAFTELGMTAKAARAFRRCLKQYPAPTHARRLSEAGLAALGRPQP